MLIHTHFLDTFATITSNVLTSLSGHNLSMAAYSMAIGNIRRRVASLMPRIFDNIELSLLPALSNTLQVSTHADFCVGYFNLLGWKGVDALIDSWPGGEAACCRLMIGMQPISQDEIRSFYSLLNQPEIDNQTVVRLKKRMAEEFRDQLMVGAPTNADQAGLQRLSAQLRSRKVIVKLYLRHKLHAKLYLAYRTDPNN